MLPTETSYIYFYVLLGGFMTVWVFRKTIKSKSNIGQFEYIGFSAFWGIALIILWEILTKIISPQSNLFSNALATGFMLSLVGMMFAYVVGSIFLLLQKVNELGWKRAFQSFFKK